MSIIETGLAFFEGLALIASPCILPVLPLILATSIEGDKKRPLGVIIGFVLSFSLFALLSKKLVLTFNVDLQIIKTASLVLLALFGLILLSERLSEKFNTLTQGVSNLGIKLSSKSEGGFDSGIIMGVLIGLVWTPCAGPILAAVLVQVIRQESNLASLFIILAFSIGVALPMLIIALTGRKLLLKFGLLTRHTTAIRKIFGIIIILSALLIGFNVNTLPFSKSVDPIQTAVTGQKLSNELKHSYPAPELKAIEGWLNSPPLTLESLHGKVVLIDFWTYSCINCLRTLPYLTAWDKQYKEKGLVIIGVHAPEFEFEKNPENVKAAIEKYGIHYPVALDNTLSTWTAFQNLYWPAHYLIDKNGQVVYTHFGEGNYNITENNIRYLLGIKGENPTLTPNQETIAYNQTPETYLGSLRAQRYMGMPSLNDKDNQYQFANPLYPHAWSLNGQWKVEPQKIISNENGAKLRFHFTAKKVFLVMGTTTDNPIDISLTLNGKRLSKITITNHSLYELVNQENTQSGLLEITANAPGIEMYAFTFGE